MAAGENCKTLILHHGYLKEHLEINPVMDDLYENGALTLSEYEEIKHDTKSRQKRVEELLFLLQRKEQSKYNIFLESLNKHQHFIIEHMGVKMVDVRSGSQTGQLGMEDSSQVPENAFQEHNTTSSQPPDGTILTIGALKRQNRDSMVSFKGTVMKTIQENCGSGKRKYEAIIADKNAAVKLNIFDSALFENFEEKDGIFIKKAKWNGTSVNVMKSSEAITVPAIPVGVGVVEDSFGTGTPIPIKDALRKPKGSKVSVMGKVVKMSQIKIRKLYESERILAYREVLLQDRSAEVNIGVYTPLVEDVKLDRVVNILSCKVKQPNDDPPFVTCPDSKVKFVSIELSDITVHDNYATGNIDGNGKVSIYRYCSKRECYRNKLTDLDVNESENTGDSVEMKCDVCDERYKRIGPLEVNVQLCISDKTVEVFWPQMEQLFSFFNIEYKLSTDSKLLRNTLKKLRGRKVQYLAHLNVLDFKKV